MFPQNVVLMNSHWVEPHHGALTDVNIWDRMLPEQEQSDWMFCKTETGGNVVSWKSAQLNITGLNTHLINREETCPGPKNITKLIAFNNSFFNFFDSVKLCQNLGGQIAVATDGETCKLMNQIFAEVCVGGTAFFSGHTDSEERTVVHPWSEITTYCSGAQL